MKMKKYEIFTFLNEYDLETGELLDCIKESSIVECDDYDKASEIFDKIEKISKE
jgi:hypothetical protein